MPALGRMKVAAVSHADVDAFHRKISARAPTHANRALACLSKMFSLSVRWGWRSDNPCKGVERNQESKRHRYLTGAELGRLTKELAELRDQGAANAVRLLLLTGARRGELLAAKWADFDLDAGIWTKPGSTTKQRTLHRVPLSAAACRLLAEMRATMASNGCSLPAACLTASTSTTPGMRCARPPTFPTSAYAIFATPTPACWRRRGCRCRSLVACSVIRPRRRRTGTHTCSMIRCARD